VLIPTIFALLSIYHKRPPQEEGQERLEAQVTELGHHAEQDVEDTPPSHTNHSDSKERQALCTKHSTCTVISISNH
jgi:hypothetical protein